jgi:hypothetical protein
VGIVTLLLDVNPLRSAGLGTVFTILVLVETMCAEGQNSVPPRELENSIAISDPGEVVQQVVGAHL